MTPDFTRKKCGGCQVVQDISAFGSNKARRDGLQSHCRDCKKAIQAGWYAKNKERHVDRVNQGRKKRTMTVRKLVFEYLQQHPCVDCGTADPALLEFDHVRGETRKDISQMVCDGLAWDTILSEIAKCDVRCVRCHRCRTALQLGYSTLSFLPREVCS